MVQKEIVTSMRNQDIETTSFKNLPNCLSNKVADDTSIVDIHAWTICVEDSGNANFCENMEIFS